MSTVRSGCECIYVKKDDDLKYENALKKDDEQQIKDVLKNCLPTSQPNNNFCPPPLIMILHDFSEDLSPSQPHHK